jgi:transcriptional regulator GlxA family with amidase domain
LADDVAATAPATAEPPIINPRRVIEITSVMFVPFPSLWVFRSTNLVAELVSVANKINERVVVDGDWVFAAGVTAGIDGALQLTANLRREDVARGIQPYMAYAPEPPFNSGTPEGAPAAVLDKARASLVQLTKRREQTARKIAERLGVKATTLDPF